MAIKPMLFNTEMVQAILDERKTCTRRLVKGYIPKNAQFGYTAFTPFGTISCRGLFETPGRPGYGEKFFKLPYQPGDILYVRETWCALPVNEAGHMRGHSVYYYKADGDLRPEGWRGNWHPSIHMPKEAARIWLKVTNVRVERLQDITIEGIRKEGLTSAAVHVGDVEIALEEWKILWDSTIKKQDRHINSWDANPFVWVIEFEQCEKPEESIK